MKPIIIVTSSVSDDELLLKMNRAYTACVERAGGIAIIPDLNLENIDALMSVASGILFSGGVDIDPRHFNETPIKQLGEITPIRDSYEILLAKCAAKKNMPMLGICRGAQLINTAFGGKLYQDIYSQRDNTIKHNQNMPKHYPSHSVLLSDDSVLGSIYGAREIWVNSLHHQAVSVPGDGFAVVAVAPDGVVEAIEHKELLFCIGVQWHPEQMADSSQHELFKQFIRYSKKYERRRNFDELHN